MKLIPGPVLCHLVLLTVPLFAKLPPMEEFGFDPSSSLFSRIRPAPGFAVDHINSAIYSRGRCAPYEASPLEKEKIRLELSLLPPLCQKAVRERVLGIYFLDGMKARGITETVYDKNGREYWIIYLNRKTITESTSRLLTEKINTAFTRKDPAVELTVDCGPLATGLSYILLHETAHAADFSYRLSPRSAAGLRKNPSRYPAAGPVWSDFTKPRPEYDFPERTNLAFYGRARIVRPDVSDAAVYLSRIEDGPFVSLYATLNWHEDLAELLTFFVLTEKRKCPYVISVRKDGRIVKKAEPMKFRGVRGRRKVLDVFFHP